MNVKCSPVCPFENNNCCMAQLLSKQDDFCCQESLLEQKIKARGHMCVFLPKFHYELNPIEMVNLLFISIKSIKTIYSTGAGASGTTMRFIRELLQKQKGLHMNLLMHALLMSFTGSSTTSGNSWMLINRG
jgi:hypothetical protein